MPTALRISARYGPEAALIAESFSPRLRYSGTSTGYQLASIIAELNSFNTFARRDPEAESDPLSSAAVFAGLMDAIADRLADILENIAAELDALSHRLFRTAPTEPAARRPPASGDRER